MYLALGYAPATGPLDFEAIILSRDDGIEPPFDSTKTAPCMR
jgi:hypothetical protein